MMAMTMMTIMMMTNPGLSFSLSFFLFLLYFLISYSSSSSTSQSASSSSAASRRRSRKRWSANLRPRAIAAALLRRKTTTAITTMAKAQPNLRRIERKIGIERMKLDERTIRIA